MTHEVTFVLCIEQNAIRAQALLLCESLRQFGGRHRGAPILAVAPRAGLGVDRETRRRLEALSRIDYGERCDHVVVDASRPFEEVLLQVKRAIWDRL